MIKEQKQNYVAPTVVTVEFRVEVGQTLSATSQGLTGPVDWTLTTSSQPNGANGSGQRSTSDFFEYDW